MAKAELWAGARASREKTSMYSKSLQDDQAQNLQSAESWNMSLDDILQNVELALVRVTPSEEESSLKAQKACRTTNNVCESCGKQVEWFVIGGYCLPNSSSIMFQRFLV